MKFTNRVLAVTCGGSSIGKATVNRLAEDAASVVTAGLGAEVTRHERGAPQLLTPDTPCERKVCRG